MTMDECIEILRTIEKDRCTPIIPAYEHDAIELAISALKREQWIPCSERIPEEDDEVLACDTYGQSLIGYISKSEESDTGYMCDSDNETMYDAIAWKSLPEPYKEPEK